MDSRTHTLASDYHICRIGCRQPDNSFGIQEKYPQSGSSHRHVRSGHGIRRERPGELYRRTARRTQLVRSLDRCRTTEHTYDRTSGYGPHTSIHTRRSGPHNGSHAVPVEKGQKRTENSHRPVKIRNYGRKTLSQYHIARHRTRSRSPVQSR